MNTKKHYAEIDILKGIAITMVILGHSVIRYPINLHEVTWTKAVYDWVETMHMPLFFMISGFCYSYKGNYGTFIKKKVQRILIPYVIFNLIDCVPRAFLGFIVNRPKPIGESIKSMLLYGGEYWFLYALMVIFLIFPLIEKIAKNKYGLLCLIIGSCVLKFVPNLPNTFLIWRIVYFFFYFIAGYAMKQFFDIEKTASWIMQHKLVCILIMGLLIVFQVIFIPVYVTDYNQIYGIVLAVVGIVLCYSITVLIKEKHFSSLLSGFGIYSLQLYLLNGFLLVISRTLVVTVLGCTTPSVILMVNMLVDLLLSYLIIKYVAARFQFTRTLFGIV